LILDASVAVKWFLLDEDLIEEARTIRDALLDDQLRLTAPTVLWSEVTQSVVKAVRRGRLDRKAARSIAYAIAEVRPLLAAVDLDPVGTVLTAVETDLNAYDAQYLSLGAGHGVSVLTADRRMLDQGRAHGYDVVWLGDVTLRDGVLVDTPQGYQG
jgi:predicted nucleic acid-binding protein